MYQTAKRRFRFSWRFSIFSSWSRLRQHDAVFSSRSQRLHCSVLYIEAHRKSDLNNYIQESTRATSGFISFFRYSRHQKGFTGMSMNARMRSNTVLGFAILSMLRYGLLYGYKSLISKEIAR